MLRRQVASQSPLPLKKAQQRLPKERPSQISTTYQQALAQRVAGGISELAFIEVDQNTSSQQLLQTFKCTQIILH